MERELQILQAEVNRKLGENAKDIGETITKITQTGTLLDDYLPPVKAVSFIPSLDQDEDKYEILMNFEVGGQQVSKTVHPHAVGQLGSKLGIPSAYLREIWTGKGWQKNAAARLLNEYTDHASRERILVRSYDGQIRGVLSDRYRRLNTMKLFLAFLMAVKDTGSKIVRAHAGDTKNFLEVIDPEIVHFDTPKNGKSYAIFGSRIRNSDFGDGAMEVNRFMMNVVCMNGMVGQSVLNKVHLGGRIPDNLIVSERTMIKDTEATASLITDAVGQLYQPQTRLEMVEKIQDASNISVDFEQEVKKLPKLGISKAEIEALEKILMNNDPANGLQGEPTKWKFKRELETIAGSMLGI